MSVTSGVREGTRRVTFIASVICAIAGVFYGLNRVGGMEEVFMLAGILGIVGWFIPILLAKTIWYIYEGFKSRGE